MAKSEHATSSMPARELVGTTVSFTSGPSADESAASAINRPTKQFKLGSELGHVSRLECRREAYDIIERPIRKEFP